MIIDKLWGHEEVIANHELYCLKLLHLKQGARSSLHYHEKKDETFYCLSGWARLRLGDATYELRPHAHVRIFPTQPHSFYGVEDTVLIEVSTHHDDMDVVRIEPSEASPKRKRQ
jgi:quercetin dioxygenase-like cupin family protein